MSVLIFSSSQTPVCETSNFVAFFNCMRIVDVKNNEKDLFTKLNSSYLNYLMTHRKGYLWAIFIEIICNTCNVSFADR